MGKIPFRQQINKQLKRRFIHRLNVTVISEMSHHAFASIPLFYLCTLYNLQQRRM
ncbi:hypothetical protein ERO13_D07G148801v2 [Gossypium hirsutum]|nr:hypothetical protein ERO13_D07G148801v2 [Gossypium hirsutum]